MELTIREKIAQLLMVGFHGEVPSEQIKDLIQVEKIGAVILFARNIQTNQQTRNLIKDLQCLAKKNEHPYPLLIATDQENGIVRRLNDENTSFPSNMLLGAVNQEQLTYEVSKATAFELKDLGINMNLAPVLDVNNNPQNPVIGVRSFGERVEDVIKHGQAFIRGHQDSRVMTSAKHFPGHGNTAIDSHLDLPVVSTQKEDLQQVEFAPFQAAIKQNIDSIMVNHVYYPAIDPKEKMPASLSENVITGVLRNDLQFDNVVLTDCLEMKAVSATIGTPEGALQALKAGADILMVSQTYAIQKQTIDRLEKAVQDGEISIERIETSLRRINHLKQAYLSWQQVLLPEQPAYKKNHHEALAKKAYSQGVTVIGGEDVLPKIDKSKQGAIIWHIEHNETIAEDSSVMKGKMTSILEQVKWDEYHLPHVTDDDHIQKLMEQITPANYVLILSNAQRLKEEHVLFLHKLRHGNKQVIFVALKSPYILANLPEEMIKMATYDPSDLAIKTVFSILFGKQQAKGKLPITI